MKNWLILSVIMCLTLIESAQQYNLNAQLTGFKDGTKFYLNDTESNLNIDSAVLLHGNLKFTGTLRETPQSLWMTSIYKNEYYYCTLLMGNEKLNIKGNIKDFPYYLNITGSKTQDVHNKMIELIREGYKN